MRKMKTYKHLISKDQSYQHKATNTNINQLLKRAKEQEIGEKKKNIYRYEKSCKCVCLDECKEGFEAFWSNF